MVRRVRIVAVVFSCTALPLTPRARFLVHICFLHCDYALLLLHGVDNHNETLGIANYTKNIKKRLWEERLDFSSLAARLLEK